MEKSINIMVESIVHILSNNNPSIYLYGSILTLDNFLGKKDDKVVYWGTSGERITEQYYLDVFSTIKLLDDGRLIYGLDIRDLVDYPKKEDVIEAIKGHYNAIRTYAVKTDQSIS